MVLGLTLPVFTAVHVAISLIGIASGLVVVFGMLAAKPLPLITALFLVTTVLTSVTGFFFPFHGITPGIIVGILSLVVLALAIPALYSFRLVGPWRAVYVIGSVIALWFNVFVLIAQLFAKVPALHALAPKGSEPPFAITQVIFLAIFVVLAVLAARKFHPPLAA